MSKQSGLGDRLYVGGVNLSGDVGSVKKIGGSIATLEVTGIDKSAFERIGGMRDGGIDFDTFFNPAAGASHQTLKALPTTDIQVSYFRGAVLGSPAASCVTKQIDYAGERADDGAFTFSVSATSNGFGLEWGRQLTAGAQTDTTATNGTAIDTLASASFGWQAYLHVFSVTGTSVTVTLQDSADNVSFANITGGAFTAVLAAATSAQRLASATNTATVRRYVRAITSGTFSNAQFAVSFVKNEIAGQVF